MGESKASSSRLSKSFGVESSLFLWFYGNSIVGSLTAVAIVTVMSPVVILMSLSSPHKGEVHGRLMEETRSRAEQEHLRILIDFKKSILKFSVVHHSIATKVGYPSGLIKQPIF